MYGVAKRVEGNLGTKLIKGILYLSDLQHKYLCVLKLLVTFLRLLERYSNRFMCRFLSDPSVNINYTNSRVLFYLFLQIFYQSSSMCNVL